MTAADVKKLRRLLDATQVDFAAYLGVSRRTVQGWEKDGPSKGPITKLLSRMLREATKAPNH